MRKNNSGGKRLVLISIHVTVAPAASLPTYCATVIISVISISNPNLVLDVIIRRISIDDKYSSVFMSAVSGEVPSAWQQIAQL